MPFFQQKPLIVEAHQVTLDNLEWIATWCGGAVKGMKLPVAERVIDIPTRDGEARVELNDWVIRGVKGDFFSCKPDVFKTTYTKDIKTFGITVDRIWPETGNT